MKDFIGFLIDSLFQFINLDKELLKQFFANAGLEHVWTVLRDHYIYNYEMWFLGIIPCLLLQHLMPAKPRINKVRAHILLDCSYPFFAAAFTTPFMLYLIAVEKSFLEMHFGFIGIGLFDNTPLALQFIGTVLLMDLVYWFAHFLNHKVKWFWYFHAIHHSQTDLNPFTTFRGHFFSQAINTLIRTLPFAFIGGSTPSWFVYAALYNFWSYFVHSNIKTNLGPLGFILVSPQYHRVHHSLKTEHIDKNFGERFVFWDWLFGSIVKDRNCYPDTGIHDHNQWMNEKDASPHGLLKSWLLQSYYPFYMISNDIKQWFRNRKGFERL